MNENQFLKKQYNNKGKIMLEDKINTLFSESTEMYCQGNYEACLALLSDCLALELDKSIIYSNRSIAHYHLKQIQNSYEDLEQALATNHLNYIAYFNLFSMQFLNGNRTESFKNLCLCLSSAYTMLCRCEPSLESASQSIYYSWNNKQSLLLKAMLIYQKNQLRASLQLLKKIQQLENSSKNRNTIISYINAIQEEMGLSKSCYLTNSEVKARFILQTDVPLPQEIIFQAQLSKMLKQFNEVYRKLNDEMEMRHELKSNLDSSLVSEKSEDDKEVNRITAYNSTTFSRNAEQEDQRITMELSRNKQLNLLSMIHEKSKQNQESHEARNTGISEVKSSNKIGQKVKFFIQEAILNTQFDNSLKRSTNIYAILSYKQGKQSFEHRTSVIQGFQGNLKWQEWTDDLNLPTQSTVQIRLLNKRYTAFKDELIAKGEFSVTNNGSFTIPLYYEQESKGKILVTVEVQ